MFLKNLIKKAKTVVDTTEDINTHFFAQVMEEIESGFKNKGINGKAIAMSAGDEAKANSIYIELRAKALQEVFVKEREEEEKKEKERRKIIGDTYSLINHFKYKIIDDGFKNPWWGSDTDFTRNGKSYNAIMDYDDLKIRLIESKNTSIELELDVKPYLVDNYPDIDW